MEIPIVTVACAASTILQGVVAGFSLRDILQGAKMPPANKAGLFSGVSVIGMAVTMFIGFWVFYHPRKAEIKTVYVEKPVYVPCGPEKQQNGAATARGGRDAFAHSGNNDTFKADSDVQPKKEPR